MEKIINFFKQFMKKLSAKKGFSLIELLVVVAIIGVLAAVAIPAYNGYRQGAAEKASKAEIAQIVKAYQACTAEGSSTTCLSANVNNTLTKSCSAAPTGSTAPGADGCHFAGTAGSAGCFSSTRKIGTKTFHHCFDIDDAAGTAKEKTGNAQWCKGGASPACQ